MKINNSFPARLLDEEIASPHFRRRFLFVPVVTSKKAQADTVVEFVPSDSDLGSAINEKYKQVMLKEVERPKRLPSEVVALMQEEGLVRFNLHHHAQLWKKLDGKNPGKGYGVAIAKTWYWYERWIDEVRKHCLENKELYSAIPEE